MARSSRALNHGELLRCSLQLLEDLTASPRHRIGVEDAAASLGISSEQVLRVVDCVGSLSNLAAGTRSGVYVEDGSVMLVGDASLLAPRRLDVNEALALACVLDTLSVPDDVRARTMAALAPVEAGGADGLPFAEEGGYGDFLPLLVDALDYGIRCRISYRSADDERASERTVDPMRIERAGGRVYLVGWDVDKDGERRYRLDRIVGLVRTDDSVQPHESIPLELDESLRAHGEAATVHADDAAELLRPGWAGLTDLHEDEQGAEASVSFTSRRWLFDHILAESPSIRLTGPKRTRAELAEYARSLIIG